MEKSRIQIRSGVPQAAGRQWYLPSGIRCSQADPKWNDPCIPLDAVSEAERAAHDDTPVAGAEHLGPMPYVGEEAIPAACTSDATFSWTRMSGGTASIQLPPVQGQGPLVFWLRDDEFSYAHKSSNGVSERYCKGVVVATSTTWLKNRVLLQK